MARIPDIGELLGLSGGLPRDKLRQFLSGAGANNQWLQIGPYNTYLRRGGQMPLEPGTTLSRPIHLANIDRTNLPSNDGAAEAATKYQPAKFRNPRGKFRELIAMLEDEGRSSGYDSVYVENILNEFLPDVLQSAGYSHLRQRSQVYPPSMYKRLR